MSTAITGRFIRVIAVWGTRKLGMKLQEEGYYAFVYFYCLWAARWTRLEQSAHTHSGASYQFTVPTVHEEFFLLCVSRNIGPTSFPLKPIIFKQKRISEKQKIIPPVPTIQQATL
jgi:hypothetical protein